MPSLLGTLLNFVLFSKAPINLYYLILNISSPSLLLSSPTNSSIK